MSNHQQYNPFVRGKLPRFLIIECPKCHKIGWRTGRCRKCGFTLAPGHKRGPHPSFWDREQEKKNE